jgi:hypothetical protein
MTMIRSKKETVALLQNTRRFLNDNAAEEEDEGDEWSFLQDYNLKFLSCQSGVYSKNEEGETEYSSVVFRLCPSSNECDSSSDSDGCKEGYGDYMVGINTFVQAYAEMLGDENNNNNNNNNGFDFNLREYAECREFEFNQEENDEGRRRRKLEAAAGYYIGPTCTSDGFNIKFALFTDYSCQEVPEITFEELTGGYSLPYSSDDAGDDGKELFIPSTCFSCIENDNGNYETSDFCIDSYENAGSKCETKMETTSSGYGKQESGCETLAELSYSHAKTGGGGGRALRWVFFMLVLAGVAGFIYFQQKQKKKKQAMANTNVNSQGLMS